MLHKHQRPRGISKLTTEEQEKENLIKRDFRSDTPLTKLFMDITEVHCSDGKHWKFKNMLSRFCDVFRLHL